jgi:hypothetical protein
MTSPKNPKSKSVERITALQWDIIRMFKQGYRPFEIEKETEASDGYIRQVRRDYQHIIDKPNHHLSKEKSFVKRKIRNPCQTVTDTAGCIAC